MAHDVGESVAQAVARVMAAEFDGGGGGTVEAEVGELQWGHVVPLAE
ncbi:MAG: hypothetical protein M5U34_17015 [Chloroflexi bacterium]|nr:hypothetical protein [Chloroflexota bacterium]